MIRCDLPAQVALRSSADETALGADVTVREVHDLGLVVSFAQLGESEFRFMMGSLRTARLSRPGLPSLVATLAGFLAPPGGGLRLFLAVGEAAADGVAPVEFAAWAAAARRAPARAEGAAPHAADAPPPGATPPPTPSGPAFPRSDTSTLMAALSGLKARFLRRPDPVTSAPGQGDSTSSGPSGTPAPSGADRRAAQRIECRLDLDTQLLVGLESVDTALFPAELRDASWLGARFLLPASERDGVLRALREGNLPPISIQREGRAWIVFGETAGRVGLAGRIVWFDPNARGDLGRPVVAVGVSFIGGAETDELRARLMQAAAGSGEHGLPRLRP